MAGDTNEVAAGGERSVGAGGNVGAAATGDHSTATYIENQYVQQASPAAELTSEQTAEALRRYAVRIRETYGRLDLEVLIPTEEGEHPPVGLDEVFVAPTVRADPPPVELPRDIRQRLVDAGEWPSSLPPGLELEALERARQAYAERPARDVLEVLADPSESRVVLLGDPGAGKSTLSRHLALTLTRGVPPGDTLEPLAGRVPLVVELREYAAGEWRERTFEDFFKHLHGTKGMAPPFPVLERLLAEGRAVVVFDGLDELFDPAAREQVSHRIADFAGRYGALGVCVVVTSRLIGYRRGVLERSGFGHYMIQDLSREQIESFARQWYDTAYPHDEQRAAQLFRRLVEALSRSRPVAELAGNPLLLTILAIVGRRRELPRDRQGVYRHAVAVLIAHWDEHAKHLRARTDVEALSFLGDEDRHELLRLVARQMQDGEGGIAGNHIHEDVLLATFKKYLCEQYELPTAQAMSAARTMARQFRERNFILSHYGAGVYGFVHRAFLEYLAAEDIELRYTRYREWTPDGLVEQVFAAHAEDPAWHEVLLLLIGRIGETEAAAAIDLLLRMHSRRPEPSWQVPLLALAVRALSEVRRIGRLAGQSQGVVNAIIRCLETADSEYGLIDSTDHILSALRSFPPQWSGHRLLQRWFHLRGQFNPWHGRSELAAASYREPRVPLALAVHAQHTPVRLSLLNMLATQCGSEPLVQECLRDRALSDPDDKVRARALLELSKVAGAAPEVMALIRERSVADTALEVRAPALSLREDDEAEALWAPVMQLAPEQAQAVTLLAQYRGTHSEVRDLLCRLVVEGSEYAVRAAALRGLGLTSGPDEEQLQELIRWRALEDPLGFLRREALDLLADGPEKTELLLDRAVNDVDWTVRLGALQTLRYAHPDAPVTEHLARRQAVEDKEPFVRGAACTDLVEVAGEQDGTWEFLRERAARETNPYARRHALAGLVKLRPDDPETWAEAWNFVTGESDGIARAPVLQAMAEFGDRSDAWTLTLDRLRNDPETEVRITALRLLRFQEDDEAGLRRATLRERAIDEADRPVRKLALALLATGDQEEPLIREFATDPAPEIRVEALLWWAVCDTDDSVVEPLRQALTTDLDPAVRVAAVQCLAFGWPAHPATIPLLRERAEADEDEGVRVESARALAAAEALAPLADQLP
ncbi:HEAT repeat domain-containing protein [Streptomyces sp. NPDC047081]|uniref:HEAT repeat domain-containing protein n=1 Tax=Streptomyces sp. NPDC047081 TaxID=3154706 RepID=UPI0033E9D6AC